VEEPAQTAAVEEVAVVEEAEALAQEEVGYTHTKALA
jgi:hypothetical protein